jgi:uncharacterized protein YjbI with pentapeptide repeats
MKPAHFLAAVILSLGTASSSLAGCSDPVGARVDWRGCSLHKANLSRANLVYANLLDADLSGANLSGATWRDGRVCGEGSIGECK